MPPARPGPSATPSSGSRLAGVPAGRLAEAWPHVRAWVESACAGTNGRYEPADVYAAIAARDWQLWVAERDGRVEAACVTEVVRYPRAAYARIVLGTGVHRRHWQHFALDLERWARAHGCAGVESVCRTGWARIFKRFGYAASHAFIEKTFTTGDTA